MLHTPLNHSHHPSPVHNSHPHAPAHHTQHQHVQAHTPAQGHVQRCSPVHGSPPHELNFADWLHMSPAQVAMMSPVGAPYTPPSTHHHHHLFVPTPSPLQYSAVTAANPNARNDFLATTSPLSYSSPPFQYPHLNPYDPTAAMAGNQHFQQMHTHQQVPTISVSMDDMRHQLHEDPLVPAAHTANGSGPSPSPLNTEYFPYASGPVRAMSSSSTSPVSHAGSPYPFDQAYARASGGEGESTPVTTLSAADESQQTRAVSSQDTVTAQQHLIDKLRGASPVTDTGSKPASPQRAQRKPPVESAESPFRIAAPQPRPGSGLGPSFSPLPASSRPASALGALSELAELASRQPTPSQPLVNSSLVSPAPHSHPSSRAVSRPTSALSTRSTVSHAKLPKVRRKQPPPHRFTPSLLQVNLPYQTSSSGDGSPNKPSTPSLADALARGPLEFEDDGPRYRTRSKLRILKAEMQEREREADLLLIRRGLRGELGTGGADGGGDKTGLDILASVSVTRRIELEPLQKKRSESPASVYTHSQKAAARPKTKRNLKRAFKDLEDADCESVTTGSECGGSRTPSKRQRVPTEKAVAASTSHVSVKKEPLETRSLRNRSHAKQQAGSPVRPSPARTSSQKSNNGKKAVGSVKSAKTTPTPVVSTRSSAVKRGAAVKTSIKKDDDAEMALSDNGESELSSLSSMSETEEDGKSSADGDTDYSPKKKSGARSSKPSNSGKQSSTTHARTQPQAETQTKPKASSTPIDTARGAAAIPFPVRRFPPDVPIHAGFPLLYRKFPVCGYTDPTFNEVLPGEMAMSVPGLEVLSFGAAGGANGMSSPLSSLTSSPSSHANANPGASEPSGDAALSLPPPPSSGHFNLPRSAEDLYTPRFVRGVGRDKMGLCPICYESPERGGAGRAEWLSMKFSAFNYHMQYAHGISPITAQPFSPPVAFRVVKRSPNHKNEKHEMLEGKCHRCLEWAPVEGVKCVEAKLKEIYWWKHAAQCHKGSTIQGESDVHLDDAIAVRAKRIFDIVHARQHPSVPPPSALQKLYVGPGGKGAAARVPPGAEPTGSPESVSFVARREMFCALPGPYVVPPQA
ncbi:hypothetical protein ACEPAH_9542 [Sanghuangporus vaninii]